METNKVIEQVGDIPEISIRFRSDLKYKCFQLTQDWKIKKHTTHIPESKATEVAKAICPKYQELEDMFEHNLNRCLEIAEERDEANKKNAKLLEALNETLLIINLHPHFCDSYEWRAIKYKLEAIQQSETK